MVGQNFLFYCTLLSFGVFLTSGCQSNIREHVKKLQEKNPQNCMQCKELKISKLCESSTFSKSNKACGKASINYHMIFNKQNCGKAIVNCFPRSLTTAVIAVDNPFSNFTSGNTTEMEINTNLFVEEIQRDDFVDEELDGFLYISPEKKTLTTTTLICNDKGEWEATSHERKLVTGITQVHCIVRKFDP